MQPSKNRRFFTEVISANESSPPPSSPSRACPPQKGVILSVNVRAHRAAQLPTVYASRVSTATVPLDARVA
jgi:hypothetical protein